MGSSNSSSERITISREDEILLTDAVVHRLQNQFSTPEEAPKPPPVVPKTHDAPVDDYVKTNRDLQRIEKSYIERLEKLEKRNEALFKDAAQEFGRTVERVERKFLRFPEKPCCLVEQQLVEKCYASNPTRTLLCSGIVSDYERCVRHFKLATVEKSKPPGT